MKKLNWLLLCLPLFAACSSNKMQKDIVNAETTMEADTLKNAPISFYFDGGFTYFADAASLYDCITGTSMPVAMKGKYLEIEKNMRN